MSLASSLSPNLFVGEVAWKLRIEPPLGDSEEHFELRASVEDENSILTKFVNMEGTEYIGPISVVFYYGFD